jgi:hypothetical protein
MHAVIPRGVDWLPVPSAESIGPELRGGSRIGFGRAVLVTYTSNLKQRMRTTTQCANGGEAAAGCVETTPFPSCTV